MNFFEYSSNNPSTRCSSRPVPKATVTNDWVFTPAGTWPNRELAAGGRSCTRSNAGRQDHARRARQPETICDRMTAFSKSCQTWKNRDESIASSASGSGDHLGQGPVP